MSERVFITAIIAGFCAKFILDGLTVKKSRAQASIRFLEYWREDCKNIIANAHVTAPHDNTPVDSRELSYRARLIKEIDIKIAERKEWLDSPVYLQLLFNTENIEETVNNARAIAQPKN